MGGINSSRRPIALALVRRPRYWDLRARRLRSPRPSIPPHRAPCGVLGSTSQEGAASPKAPYRFSSLRLTADRPAVCAEAYAAMTRPVTSDVRHVVWGVADSVRQETDAGHPQEYSRSARYQKRIEEHH